MEPAPGKRGLAYYRAHFLETFQAGGVVCLECGRLRKALGTHVLRLQSTAALLRRVAIERGIGAHGSGEMLARARAARQPRRLRPQARLKLSELKRRLYASGWQPPRHRKAEDETLQRLAETGADVKGIPRATGLSVSRTRLRLQALGLLPPARRRWKVDRAAILALRRRGLWPLEIAGRLGVQPQLVKKTLWLAARLGVSRRYVVHKTWKLRRRGVIPPVSRGPEMPAPGRSRPAAAPAAGPERAPTPAAARGGSA